MSYIQQIDLAIQLGRQAKADVMGQQYMVYRLAGTTAGSVISQSPVLTVNMRIKRVTSKQQFENATFDLLVFDARVNATVLKKGDVFVEFGYGADPEGVYTLVQSRPTRETLLIRTESNVSIVRPHPSAGSSESQPASGAVFASGYGGVQAPSAETLTLDGGLYSFGNVSGTLASVPCGLQPLGKPRDGRKPEIPTLLQREFFLAYVPLMPGVALQENYELKFPTADTYVVRQVYSSDKTGVAGWIAHVEKKAT